MDTPAGAAGMMLKKDNPGRGGRGGVHHPDLRRSAAEEDEEVAAGRRGPDRQHGGDLGTDFAEGEACATAAGESTAPWRQRTRKDAHAGRSGASHCMAASGTSACR